MTTTEPPEPDPEDDEQDQHRRREELTAAIVRGILDSPGGQIAAAATRTLAALGQLVMLVLILAMFLGVVAGVVFGMWKVGVAVLPDEITPTAEIGFVDLIFGNRWVIFAARVVLLAAAMALFVFSFYVVLSVVARTIKKQWLRSAGGFQADVADKVQSDIESAEAAMSELDEHRITNARLAEQLEQVTDEMQSLYSELARVYDELGEHESPRGGPGVGDSPLNSSDE